MLGVPLGRPRAQIVQLLDAVILVVEQEVAEELVERAFVRVERAKANVRQVSLVASHRGPRRVSCVLLKGGIPGVESTDAVRSGLSTLCSELPVRALCCLEICECSSVVLGVELEDAPVEIEVLQVEDVLVVIAHFLQFAQHACIYWFVQIDRERRHLSLLLLGQLLPCEMEILGNERLLNLYALDVRDELDVQHRIFLLELAERI